MARTKSHRKHRTHRTHKARKTHKSKGHMSIPDLRHAMHQMTNVCKRLHHMRGSHQEKVRHLQAEWRARFGKSLGYKAASNYLSRGHRGTRKMRGGVLGGAPLDSITRQSLDLPLPDSKYLPYVNGGFTNPMPGIAQSCGSQQGVMPYSSTGSNLMGQAGGSYIGDFVNSMLPQSLTTASAALQFRPYVGQNPPTTQQSTGTFLKGMPMRPGPESYNQAWTPKMPQTPIPPIPIAVALDRVMTNDTLIPTPTGFRGMS
jgi:hypothetical protein